MVLKLLKAIFIVILGFENKIPSPHKKVTIRVVKKNWKISHLKNETNKKENVI